MMFEHADGEPVLVLTEDQCWQLLEGTQHGRLVSVVAGRAEIFPVNVAAQDRTLVIRTNPGTKLATMAINEDVVFEADGILSDQAWSVVVRGTAKLLQTSTDISAAEQTGLQPWVPTKKDRYVRITPSEINGRHFRFGPHPEPELGEGSETG